MNRSLSRVRTLLLSNRLSALGFFIVVILSLIAILVVVTGGSITPYSAYKPNYQSTNLPPGLFHPMGTGFNGIDILSQVMAALPIDIGIPLVVVFVSSILGLVLGTIAGYLGGIVDEVVMRITDMFLAFPVIIMVLAVAATLGPSLVNAVLSLTFVWWPPYVRLVRGQVLQISTEDFVAISKSLNSSFTYILRKDVLPNVLPSVLVYATIDVGTAMLSLSTLGFLGVGIPPGVPELGRMVSSISYNLYTYPWQAILPALVVMITVAGFSFMGEGVRESLDVKLRPHVLLRKRALKGMPGGPVPTSLQPKQGP